MSPGKAHLKTCQILLHRGTLVIGNLQMEIVSEGCLHLGIPDGVLDVCRAFDNGQQLELLGDSWKQDDDRQMAPRQAVKMLAERRCGSLFLTLSSSTFGTVFQQKLTDVWQCEIDSVSLVSDDPLTTEFEIDGVIMVSDNTAATHCQIAKVQGEIESVTVVRDETVITETMEPPECMDTLITNTHISSSGIPSMSETSIDAKICEGTVDNTCRHENADADYVTSRDNTPQRLVKTDSMEYHCDTEDFAQDHEPFEDGSRVVTRNRRCLRSNVKQQKSSGDIAVNTKCHSKTNTSNVSDENHVAGSQTCASSTVLKAELPSSDLPDRRCKRCDRRWFSSRLALSKHVTTCAGNAAAEQGPDAQDQGFTCDVCFFRTPSLQSLKRHQRDIHQIRASKQEKSKRKQCPKDFQCKFCDQKFHTYRATFLYHVRFKCAANPDVLKPHRCIKCSKVFTQAADLQKHYDTVHAEGFKVVCDVCGKVYATRGGLYCHKLRHHNTGQQKKFRCDKCDAAFFTGTQLRRHQMRHNATYDVQCEVCSKHFKCLQDMEKHRRVIHENRQPYHCPVCGHGVNRRSYLKAHICGRVRRNQAASSATRDTATS